MAPFLLLPIFVATVARQVAFPEPIFTSTFPVASDAAVKDGTVEIDARVTGRDLAELTARRAAKYLAPGRFLATISSYPPSRDKAKKAYLNCSFLVDCDEPAVKATAEAAATEIGASKRVPELTSWVARYISTKTFSRSFDLASTVAAWREGDCTEHAVLLAALVRARKIPARVILGLALLESPKVALAVGHAWVEWHDGKQWLLADAALTAEGLAKFAGSDSIRVSYLPVRVIDREDAGYTAGLLDGFDITDISRVVIPAPKSYRDQVGSRARPTAP
jgi:transglutaminase-like putative cysteine protease